MQSPHLIKWININSGGFKHGRSKSTTLAELILESMKEVGPSEWTEEEIEFAKKINETYQPGMKMRAVERYKLDEKYLEMYLYYEIYPEIIGKE